MPKTPLQVGQIRYMPNDGYRVNEQSYFFVVTNLKAATLMDTQFCEIMFLDTMTKDMRAIPYLERNSFLVTGEDGEHKNGS
jgi:hypothetical protein